MLRGYRCIFAAIAGLALVGAAQAQVGGQPKASETKAQQAKPENWSPPTTKWEQEGPQANAQRCDNPQRDNGPDICAQWVAANAARDAAKISEETLRWNIAAFFAILATLIATGWAAWAAGTASSAANASLDLFQKAEAGELAPFVTLNSRDVVTLGFKNTGRTGVVIVHADVCCSDKEIVGAIPFFLTNHDFDVDVLIREDGNYVFGGGPQGITHANREAWIYGGAVYRTVFGRIGLARMAAVLDRTTGRTRAIRSADYSEWEMRVREKAGNRALLD